MLDSAPHHTLPHNLSRLRMTRCLVMTDWLLAAPLALASSGELVILLDDSTEMPLANLQGATLQAGIHLDLGQAQATELGKQGSRAKRRCRPGVPVPARVAVWPVPLIPAVPAQCRPAGHPPRPATPRQYCRAGRTKHRYHSQLPLPGTGSLPRHQLCPQRRPQRQQQPEKAGSRPHPPHRSQPALPVLCRSSIAPSPGCCMTTPCRVFWQSTADTGPLPFALQS